MEEVTSKGDENSKLGTKDWMAIAIQSTAEA